MNKITSMVLLPTLKRPFETRKAKGPVYLIEGETVEAEKARKTKAKLISKQNSLLK